MESVLRTVGLLLVLEGILPFLLPHSWRNTVGKMARMNDRQIRGMGFAAIFVGVVLFQTVVWASTGNG